MTGAHRCEIQHFVKTKTFQWSVVISASSIASIMKASNELRSFVKMQLVRGNNWQRQRVVFCKRVVICLIFDAKEVLRHDYVQQCFTGQFCDTCSATRHLSWHGKRRCSELRSSVLYTVGFIWPHGGGYSALRFHAYSLYINELQLLPCRFVGDIYTRFVPIISVTQLSLDSCDTRHHWREEMMVYWFEIRSVRHQCWMCMG